MRVTTRQVAAAPAASTPAEAGPSVDPAAQPALGAAPEPAPAVEEPPLPEAPLDFASGTRGAAPPPAVAPPRHINPMKPTADDPADDLLTQVMDDEAVQTMLEVFPAEIKDVEEI